MVVDDLGIVLLDVVEKGVFDCYLGFDVDVVEWFVDDDYGGVGKECSCDLGFFEYVVGIVFYKIVMVICYF